ncbi:LysM peptidoglycan-binding domain-containing protein [Mesobacillus foraminis]|uniref:3D domain-containing protein n=1 Tax=Mesobacillus foraminis TaxID=279826 RepID=UPI001BEC985F|nr:3D domain-containing protein [Mesobacillus foraminis]MBT2757255.1 LysM peptidoglycan-binding domain-containing protein [Mesobacillus foraminis]
MKKLLFTMIPVFFILFGMSNLASAASNTYTVKKGDTLYGIAIKHKTTVNSIKSWNKLKSNTIHPNQKLKVSGTKVTASKPKAKAKTTTTSKTKNKVVKTLTVNASAFTANCKGCSGITYTGINLKKNPNAKVISVDPKVIPLGSKVYVEGYGYAVAADKGSAIKGKRIDVFMNSYNKAIQWGRRTVKVQILK